MLPLAAKASSGSGIWESLYKASRSIIDDKLGDFASVAVVVAALFAAWTLLKTTMDWTKGGSHDLWQLLRPLVIVLCVLNFSALSGAFDGVVNIFCREIASSTDSGLDDMLNSTAKLYQSADAAEKTYEEEFNNSGGGDTWIQRTWNNIKRGVVYAAKTAMKYTEVSLLGIVTFVTRFLIDLMFLIFQVIAAMFLTVLRLIGPFAFAVAAYEPWSGSIRSWCERYIETSLWMPVGYIIIGIMTGMYTALTDGYASGEDYAVVFICLAMIFASFRAIRSIPEIAGWIISGTAHGLQQANPLAIVGVVKKAVTKL